MIKNNSIKKYNLRNKINLSKYRVTLDTLEDYFKIKKIFNKYKSIYKPSLKSISKMILSEKNIFKSDPLIKMKFDQSNYLFNNVKNLIPLGSQTFSKSYRFLPKKNSPLFIKKGSGCYFGI